MARPLCERTWSLESGVENRGSPGTRLRPAAPLSPARAMSSVAARREHAGGPARNRAPLPAPSGRPGHPAPPGPGIQGPSGQGAPDARDSTKRGRTRPVGGPPGGEEPLRPLSASVPDRSRLLRPPPRRCRPRPPPAPPPSSRSGSPPPPPAPPRPRRQQRDRARFHAFHPHPHPPRRDLPATVPGKSASTTPPGRAASGFEGTNPATELPPPARPCFHLVDTLPAPNSQDFLS